MTNETCDRKKETSWKIWPDSITLKAKRRALRSKITVNFLLTQKHVANLVITLPWFCNGFVTLTELENDAYTMLKWILLQKQPKETYSIQLQLIFWLHCLKTRIRKPFSALVHNSRQKASVRKTREELGTSFFFGEGGGGGLKNKSNNETHPGHVHS